MARPLDLTGWTPARLRLAPEPTVEWVYTGSIRFTDPFFDQTLERAVRDPFSLLFRRRTGLEALRDWAEASPGLRPAGFVTHMSRAGSTLVAQMLATCRRFLVLSEAGPLDAALRASASAPADLVRWTFSALAQPRAGETTAFVKLDSWSVLALPALEEAFPGTPWLFLYRNPAEVLASQLRRSGVHGVPGALPPELFGLDRAELATTPREEYLARVLARICEAALEHTGNPNGVFVDYSNLPAFVLERLPGHFGLELSEQERTVMAGAAQLDAKNPSVPFDPAPTAPLSAEAHAAVERWLLPLYDRLRSC